MEEIKHNELISKKHKKISRNLNHVEYIFPLVATVTGCVSISAFASLVGIPIGTASSAVGIKNCAITPEMNSLR